MKNLLFYTLIGVLMSTSFSSYTQNSYFFNQKNLFSIHASYNPRLIAKRQNNEFFSGMYGTQGLGRGTYYQYYDDNNQLKDGNQNYNLMLNTSYGRLINNHYILGIEFNYQKHNLTINENANEGYDPNTYYDETIPFLTSTPVFNVFDLQLFYGFFNPGNTAPNKHILTYGVGLRIFSLDENQNYRKNADTAFTNLSTFLEDYDQNFYFPRISLNYTFRMLLTKNLSLDIGINSNFTLTFNFDPQTGDPSVHDFLLDTKIAYGREYVKSRLGHSTFFNIFYLRTGLSLAI